MMHYVLARPVPGTCSGHGLLWTGGLLQRGACMSLPLGKWCLSLSCVKLLLVFWDLKGKAGWWRLRPVQSKRLGSGRGTRRVSLQLSGKALSATQGRQGLPMHCALFVLSFRGRDRGDIWSGRCLRASASVLCIPLHGANTFGRWE